MWVVFAGRSHQTSSWRKKSNTKSFYAKNRIMLFITQIKSYVPKSSNVFSFYFLLIIKSFQSFDIHKVALDATIKNICNRNAFTSRRRSEKHARTGGMEEVYISVLIVKLLNCIICVYARTQQIFFIFHWLNALTEIIAQNEKTREPDQWRWVRNGCWGRGINVIIYVMLTIYIFKWMVI